MILRVRIVIPDTRRSANRRFSVARHIPSETESGSKLQQPGVSAGVRGEARIAGIIKTRRRILEHRAVNALDESIVADGYLQEQLEEAAIQVSGASKTRLST